MKVLINAYESYYEGLHGISEIDIVEVRDKEQAIDIAEDMSQMVIESYLYDEEDDIYESTERVYEIYEIKDNLPCGDDEYILLDLYYSLGEEFLTEYCSQKII